MWYVKITILYILYTTFGPYENLSVCQSHLNQMRNEGLSRYEAGERVSFMGKEVNPKTVKMTCVQMK